MNSLNGNDNETNNLKSLIDIDAFKSRLVKPETRTDSENEAIAERLADKLGSFNPLPLLAVSYSGIPRSVIDRHLATACEVGREPIKLFMHLISREPLWQQYQAKKAERRASDGA